MLYEQDVIYKIPFQAGLCVVVFCSFSRPFLSISLVPVFAAVFRFFIRSEAFTR